MTSSPHLFSAREIAAQIRRKAVSPVEVARAHLDRIERLNPKLNAFVDCKPEAVLAQAREAEKAILRGGELGPLHGVPVSTKSAIDVAGHLCEAGTRLRAGHIAAEDAPLVARLRAAGAVILGVTNTPELLERRRGCRHRRGTFGRRRGQRRRRFDPRTGALLRHLRIEAHSRTYSIDRTLSEICWPLCVNRSGRADGTHDRRRANTI